MAGLMHMSVYVVTFDVPTLVIVCSVVTLIFFIFYQIFYGLFYWFMEMRPNELHDLEEGTHLASYGASGSSQRVTIFHALVLGNLQAWTMVAALEGDFDENRGQKLRASKKLPPLVNYGKHEAIRSCNECAICLEDFDVDQFCQVFPVCKHIFHSDCIDHWLQKKLTCPICRSRCIQD
ncbi:putative RING-H2 finger protein ATL19 [Gastrolobium bilobum]|uniref:putative RING-H2 finger protein ATL19 n=1 Tax=Gastrolobium bilobum TaxID=150636 RepID=UPI002AB1C80E|nr:putative RING-H2 finger protein ATL19 [Gastrolobium bilobum]